jgi:cell fate (sporulation/competence/biofilm development) regulator YlbF (YheA/YmcA/DUF963 family)
MVGMTKEELIKEYLRLKEEYETVAKPILDAMNEVKKQLRELMFEGESVDLGEKELVKQVVKKKVLDTKKVRKYLTKQKMLDEFMTEREEVRITLRKKKEEEDEF